VAFNLFNTNPTSEDQDKKMILNAYRDLMKSMGSSLKRQDKKLIRRAFEIATDAHRHMRRKSGEPYILHPIAVAKIVATEISLGTTSVICALLHDTVEDTELTFDDIEREFGSTYSSIVEGLTKISNVVETNETTQQTENFRKILLTLADDPRVILIKIADRLHNMRTLASMRKDKQLKIASETSFIYAPLAHRLGLYEIKSELEDLSLKYTQEDIFNDIVSKLDNTKNERIAYIEEFITPIKTELDKARVRYDVSYRSKSINSIWNKMKNKKVSFEEVYDLFAVRFILNSKEKKEKEDCWKVYSILTNHYRPNPERLRDWISNPKSNGYEALHTTVMGPEGRWVEVQIRSARMNEIAEKGLAAHWKYKDGDTSKENKLDAWLKSIRELLTNPDSNTLELISDFKTDLFNDEIYCYTPKGEVRVLTKGGTALDFAFDIHSELGKTCIGAKVNYKLVPISHVLKNGDQVEIITSKKQKPHIDWLLYVVTGKAKSRIKYYLKEEKREKALEGQYELEKKLKSFGTPASKENLQILANHFNFDSILDFNYAISTGEFSTKKLRTIGFEGNKITLPAKHQESKKNTRSSTEDNDELSSKQFELILFGSEKGSKIDYKLAVCCNPIPGDDVFGFVTTGEGLKIHRNNCPNAPSLLAQYGHRVVKAKWAKNKEISFLTSIQITGLDDVGVINKITNIISGDLKVNMRSMSIDSKGGIFEGNITVFVKDKDELDKLLKELESLEGINRVRRIDLTEEV